MRFIGTVILMIAMVAATATGIDRLMIDTQEWITPWMAPNIIDNAHFVMTYGFAMCYMYSDVPFMQKTELYKIVRKGKKRWCAEKILAISLQGLIMAILTIGMTILIFLPRVQFDWDWER